MGETQENNDVSPVGRDNTSRGGPRKVSGLAQYTSDFHFPGELGMTYRFEGDQIAKGKWSSSTKPRRRKMARVCARFFSARTSEKSTPQSWSRGSNSVCRAPEAVRRRCRSIYGQYIARLWREKFENTPKPRPDRGPRGRTQGQDESSRRPQAEDEPKCGNVSLAQYAS